jgi:hypothetical protein
MAVGNRVGEIRSTRVLSQRELTMRRAIHKSYIPRLKKGHLVNSHISGENGASFTFFERLRPRPKG